MVEQWRLIARGLGWVVTATSDAITYVARTDGFATCAETLREEDS